MPRRRTVLAAATGLGLIGTPAYAAGGLKSLVDAQLAKITGYDTVAIGAFRGQESYAVRGGAIFQIGSITKTFTALALALHGHIDDPLAKHLPRRFPAPEGVTLAQLASHTSGLPRLPPGMFEPPHVVDPRDPWAHLTEEILIDALKKTTLQTPPGTKYLYSNFGAGLLGLALSRNYEAMVRHRITLPLRLKDTVMTLNAEQRRRKIQGYDPEGVATPDWRLPVIPGAGALYGTVDDLLRYMRAHLGDAPRFLKPALDLVQRPRFEESPEMSLGLGWHIVTLASGRKVVFHDGGTGGFTSLAGFSPKDGTGVAIIVNKFNADLFGHATELIEAL
ncbi:serine hydrolase domain-containing protein [Kibdelosporangium aridum]|uniref:CubicO group peptidase, beta-lactamase class C family n=1 Tax=Kibdelosporangium aridum TaxID=2030 RepID=A0A1W2CSH1_KIBAR|nr:serine hydrolase [Kibdelosporangium aridum]SMC88161.1 CubicO group peptidase, beta-lactamase class C family [Kibdelosporangium aridum]